MHINPNAQDLSGGSTVFGGLNFFVSFSGLFYKHDVIGSVVLILWLKYYMYLPYFY